MKTLHWIILGLTLAAATWFVYQTRDVQGRVDMAIDLNWKFMQGEQAGAGETGFDDAQWRYVSIPHDWMIEYPVDRNNPSGLAGGFYPGGIGWYRKYIDLEDYEDMSRFFILFEGVYMNADVYFNGKHLGRHAYGYASFYHDVSDLVRTDSVNILAVRTDCSKLPADRWYSGAGIYRQVRLIATREIHVPIWGMRVSSTMEGSGSATVQVALALENSGRKSRRFEIHYDIVDPSGKLVAEGKSTEFLESGQTDTALQSFTIENPLLWSPGQPSLYSVNCYLMDRNRQIDHVKTHHGIRTAEFDPELGFVLNGEKMIMKGVCLHHDGGELGAALPLESWARRFEALKKLGVNAVRLAHNPHAPGVLDLCDRMGLLVINEMYDKWETGWDQAVKGFDFNSTWKEDLGNFVRRDRNHPSVVLWSVGNETVEQLADPARARELYRQQIALVRSLDSTREVTCALHPGYADRGNEIPSSMMHLSRVVSYNYRTDSFATWHEKYPELVFLASETKIYGTSIHEDHQVIDFSDNSWNDMDEYVAGQFIWSGIDYLGESAGWPDRGWRHGLLYTNGFIKPHAWYIASRYREDPLVKLTVKDSILADELNRSTNWQRSWAAPPLVDHWSFPEDSVRKEVVVFTNCERVELKLNGEVVSSLERSSFGDGVIKSRLDYSPGELVALAYFKDGSGMEKMVTDTLFSSGQPYTLAMQSDRDQIRSDNRDVVHITTRVTDNAGVTYPHGRQNVSYSLDGPGKIRVIDNGDLADHSPQSAARELRNGKQLLILQAGSESGDLIISASAEGLKESKVKIKSKNKP